MKKVTILYGSETGTSEEVAYNLFASLVSNGLHCTIYSMNHYDIVNLGDESTIIFIVSTTGDGDPPATMKTFWRFLLRKSLPPDCLSTVKFSVFGLGDSSYSKFNSVARKLDARLKQLGAKELLPIGLGDDQSVFGYFTALNQWIKNFEKLLSAELGRMILLDKSTESSTSIRQTYEVKIEEYQNNECIYNFLSPEENHHQYHTQVTLNNRLTAESWPQDVRLLQLANITEKEIDYRAGDVAEIYYQNSIEVVTKLIEIIQEKEPHLNPISTLSIKRFVSDIRPSRLLNAHCTLSDLFKKLLDIGAVPHRGFFAILAAYSSVSEEKEKLLELSREDGTDLYFDYCVREKKSYVEVLSEFPHARPPLGSLLEAIPRIQPRPYSIASSSLVHPTKIELCVAIKTTKTPYRRLRAGLCTHFIQNLTIGAQVVIQVKPGATRGTELENTEIPKILVGPGTGVAPMRAFLQESLHCGSGGRVLLFFGCRKKGKDELFGEEWRLMQSGICPFHAMAMSGSNEQPIDTTNIIKSHSDCCGNLTKIEFFTAFSQDQLKKYYVTHKIRENGQEIWNCLKQGAAIFVSGAAKRMPNDVRKALLDVIQTFGGLGENESEVLLQKMMKEKKYIVEAWS